MSGYIGNIPVPQATQTRQSFTATAGQTTFATIGYTPNFVDVYMNGVHLLDGVDFTATNGSDISLTSGAAAGDVIEVVAYSTYQVNSQNYTGGLTVDNDGATVLTVDRATSDGTIIDVQKNGTTVGSIGNSGTALLFENPNANSYFAFHANNQSNGIFYQDGTSKVFGPYVARDDEINLGVSNGRWKDLYLSGGVYLGGTGAANKLDDYEEGTWSPFWTNQYGQTIFDQSPSASVGRYTKVGDTVHATCYFSMPASFGATASYVAGAALHIGGLPFIANRNGGQDYYAGTCGWYNNLAGLAAGYTPMGYVESATSLIVMVYANGGNVSAFVQSVAYFSNSGIIFSTSYKTAS